MLSHTQVVPLLPSNLNKDVFNQSLLMIEISPLLPHELVVNLLAEGKKIIVSLDFVVFELTER